jgi:hypothetical protein
MDCHEENAAMPKTQQSPLFPSFHLDSLQRALHLRTVTAKPWWAPATEASVGRAQERLRAAVARLDLPVLPSTPCFTRSRADLLRACYNVETWLNYLPQACVRTMVLDGWHWTT